MITAVLKDAAGEVQSTVRSDCLDALREVIIVELMPVLGPGDVIEVGDLQ